MVFFKRIQHLPRIVHVPVLKKGDHNIPAVVRRCYIFQTCADKHTLGTEHMNKRLWRECVSTMAAVRIKYVRLRSR